MGEGHYEGYRWIGTRMAGRDEKVYCHFCRGSIKSPLGPGPGAWVHVLLDEEEFDVYLCCEECCQQVIGPLYPAEEILAAAAERDGIPVCPTCGKQPTPLFMHGHGLVEHTASCSCGAVAAVEPGKWPYRECEAVYRTSPIWKSFLARRGEGGVGERAARRLCQERRAGELSSS